MLLYNRLLFLDGWDGVEKVYPEILQRNTMSRSYLILSSVSYFNVVQSTLAITNGFVPSLFVRINEGFDLFNSTLVPLVTDS